jgi:hypothetical protein
MSKKIAILQSCYIPWKGFFDLINMVDEFVIYDDMQFTRRDWRNRNLIKTANGLQWLTIPVCVKGKFLQKINETMIDEKSWAEKHWKTIAATYSKADYFKAYSPYFEALYKKCGNEDSLSRVNYIFIQGICALLNIPTKLTWSTDYTVDNQLRKTERLLALCMSTNASCYVSGPSARDYLQHDLFEQAGIDVAYIDYAGYPAYNQLYGEFEHGVTILDLIFNTGASASSYMKTMRPTELALA